jgi:gamma-glutamyl:cysteine ligase YbdK (ATP-grasp superfamily)
VIPDKSIPAWLRAGLPVPRPTYILSALTPYVGDDDGGGGGYDGASRRKMLAWQKPSTKGQQQKFSSWDEFNTAAPHRQ